MRLLAIISGEYGQRHVENLRAHGPACWHINVCRAPAVLPPVIDYPEDYLPASLPPADLVLSFAEQAGVAELLPDVARLTGPRAVLAPVDNENWLPRGLARQLRGWLEAMGVCCVTPKPLCTLTEHSYLLGRRKRIAYESPQITEFARHFGQPALRLQYSARGTIWLGTATRRSASLRSSQIWARSRMSRRCSRAQS